MTTTQATVQGLVLEVSILPAGTKLTADHPISSTVLNVQDTLAFDEAGGSVSINGVIYLYSALDSEQSTMTLTTGLTTLVEEGTSVLLNPPGEEKWATVDQELGEDMIIARVPHWLADKLPDGIREESERESVIIAVQYDGWTVTDIVGQQPAINAQYIDAVPPDFTSDDQAPDSSPQPVVIGGVGSYFLSWTPVANHDPVTYSVYASASAGFTKDATTLVGTTSGSTMTVRTLTNGTPFAWDTNYYFAIRAEDIDGPGPASLESAGVQMVKITNEYVAANYVYAGGILANQIRSGLMTADVTVSGSFATAPSGQRSVMDGFGIRQYGPDGVSIITDLPNHGNPMFTGIVNAFGLVVNGRLEFRGQNNLFAMGSITTLGTTTSGSMIAANITPSWEQIDSGLTQYLFNVRGFHREADGDAPYASYTFFGLTKVIAPGGKYHNYASVLDDTGNNRSPYDIGAATWIRTAGGIRMVGHGTYYAGSGAAGVGQLSIFDPTVMTSGGTVPPLFKTGIAYSVGDTAEFRSGWTFGYRLGRCFSPIASGTLENNFALVRFDALSFQLIFRRYAATDSSITQQGSDITVPYPWTTGQNPSGVVYGSSAKMGFPGTDQNIWLVFADKAYAYTAAGVRLPDFDFPLASDANYTSATGSLAAGANGFVRFESVPGYGDPILYATKYTNIHWPSTDSSVWWATYTWFDSNGTTYESDMAAQASITMPKRMRYTVTTPNLPDPATGIGTARGPDDVNSIRVYMGRGATIPDRTAMWKQNVQPADLATTITYDTMPQFSGTTNPPPSTTFVAQAPAVLQSSAIGADGLPKVKIDGSGFMHSETLNVSGVGSTSLQGKAFEQQYFSIRTQALLAGGGTITVSPSYEVKWTARFITISRGRGANTATGGYFDITMPAAGTVIDGYGGAANKTVTAAGIPLGSWEALWYVLPYGSGVTSLPGNFRVTSYTANFNVPNDWVLICLRNSDANRVEFTTGDKILADQDNSLYLQSGSAITASTNWTMGTQQCARVGRLLYIYFIANRTNSAITAGSSGNITNVQVAQIANDWRPHANLGFAGIANGGMWMGYANSAGGIYITALPPKVDLDVGDQISGTATGILL